MKPQTQAIPSGDNTLATKTASPNYTPVRNRQFILLLGENSYMTMTESAVSVNKTGQLNSKPKDSPTKELNKFKTRKVKFSPEARELVDRIEDWIEQEGQPVSNSFNRLLNGQNQRNGNKLAFPPYLKSAGESFVAVGKKAKEQARWAWDQMMELESDISLKLKKAFPAVHRSQKRKYDTRITEEAQERLWDLLTSNKDNLEKLREELQILLERGADLYAKDEKGLTLLDHAAINGDAFWLSTFHSAGRRAIRKGMPIKLGTGWRMSEYKKALRLAKENREKSPEVKDSRVIEELEKIIKDERIDRFFELFFGGSVVVTTAALGSAVLGLGSILLFF